MASNILERSIDMSTLTGVSYLQRCTLVRDLALTRDFSLVLESNPRHVSAGIKNQYSGSQKWEHLHRFIATRTAQLSVSGTSKY